MPRWRLAYGILMISLLPQQLTWSLESNVCIHYNPEKLYPFFGQTINPSRLITMKTIAQKEEEILAEFAQFATIDLKYEHLFQLGLNLPHLDPSVKTEENKVEGCQSKLWFHLSFQQGCATLAAESDSLVINGIAALIVRMVDGCTPEEIQKLDFEFIDRLSIWKLASTRNNGLLAMLAHIKKQAEERAA